jgi:hypothetical protein
MPGRFSVSTSTDRPMFGDSSRASAAVQAPAPAAPRRNGILDGTYRAEYEAYLHSKGWKAKRGYKLWHAGYRCEVCGAKDGLEVHHKTYERLGRERDEDLVVLCPTCHPPADKERAREASDRSEAALWDARLNGWASKVYGDDWAARMGADIVEAEFEEWLEVRDDPPGDVP